MNFFASGVTNLAGRNHDFFALGWVWTDVATSHKDLHSLVSFTDVVLSVATISSLVRAAQGVESQNSIANNDVGRKFAIESRPFDIRSRVSGDRASELGNGVLFLVDDQRINCDDRCLIKSGS